MSGGIKQRFDVTSGASYASQSDQVVHIGLGKSVKADSIEIRWSNGDVEKINVEGVNRYLKVVQGKGVSP
jgi:hypothetical protein